MEMMSRDEILEGAKDLARRGFEQVGDCIEAPAFLFTPDGVAPVMAPPIPDRDVRKSVFLRGIHDATEAFDAYAVAFISEVWMRGAADTETSRDPRREEAVMVLVEHRHAPPVVVIAKIEGGKLGDWNEWKSFEAGAVGNFIRFDPIAAN